MAEETKDIDSEKELINELMTLLRKFKSKGIVVQIKGGINSRMKVIIKYR